MAAIAPVTAASAAPAAAPKQDQPTVGAKLSADFNTFLKLLTTQLKSQDPLQPMESTEFVAQLAQFSAVEQQIATNKTLGDIFDAVSGAGAGALGDWLGRDVRAPAPLDYKGGAAEAYPPEAPEGAAGATMVVRKADGGVAAEIPFTPGAKSVAWDGKLAGGADAQPGAYRFEARFAMAEGAVETRDAEIYARVIEARREDGSIVLGLAGGGSARAEDVTALREPSLREPSLRETAG